MEQGIIMPSWQGRQKFGMLGVAALTTVGVVVIVRRSTTSLRHGNGVLAEMTTQLTQLAAGECSAADRSILDPSDTGLQSAVAGCASYSIWSGWDSDASAQCLSDTIQISLSCAHCFSDAVGYAYDNCKSGECTTDQCGTGCAECLAPAKHTAEQCVGGDIVQREYTMAMDQSCRTGISGTVSADDCTQYTGLSCSSSDDCPAWSGSHCVGGTCQCNAGTCSVNGGECVAPGSCPKFTGGTCAYLGCNDVRNAQCIGAWGSGLCLCSEGQCVHNGACV